MAKDINNTSNGLRDRALGGGTVDRTRGADVLAKEMIRETGDGEMRSAQEVVLT